MKKDNDEVVDQINAKYVDDIRKKNKKIKNKIDKLEAQREVLYKNIQKLKTELIDIFDLDIIKSIRTTKNVFGDDIIVTEYYKN